MSTEVKLYWENPIEPDLIRTAFIKAFRRDCPLDEWTKLWQWRYLANPLSDGVHAAYIMDHGQVACFYAVSPMPLKCGNEKVLKAGLAVMGFSHPDFQGKGYYSRLYNHTQLVLKDLGFDCLLAFDNHNSHYPEVKYLNWRDIGILSNFALDKNELRPLKTCSEEYVVNRQELSLELLERLAKMNSNPAQYSIIRSFEYLKWRLYDNPVNQYYAITLLKGTDILACVLYKHFGDDFVDVMEIFYKDYDENNCFGYAHQLFRDLAVNSRQSINIWSNLQTAEHLAFEKLGFKEGSFSTYFVCNPLSMDKEILDIRKWHYRFMDSDVY